MEKRPQKQPSKKKSTSTIIDIYQKIDDQILGRGGMAIVYLGGYAPNAGDQTTMFAIKQMPIKQKIEQSGLDQINLLRKLIHPNIVRYIDARKQENIMFLILQYCNGGSLEKHMKENQLSEEGILRLFSQIVLAMRFLQQKKIIHRDIKPKNILLHDGVVKLADFGVAKMIDKYRQNITFEGTPQYMSPQMIKHQNYSSLTDMWSLGLTLYFMVFLELPWTQKTGTKLLNEMITKVNNGTLIPKQNISQGLRKLIQSMLKIKQEDRISWSDLIACPLISHYIAQYQQQESNLQQSNIETSEITLEQFWRTNTPKIQQVQKRGKELSQLYRDSKIRVDIGIQTYQKIRFYKDRCRFLKKMLNDLKQYRRQQTIDSKKQLFLKCHYLLAKRSYILSQYLNHIVLLKSNSQGIIRIPQKQFDQFMSLPKYTSKLNQLRNAAEDLSKYNLNQWQSISKQFMRIYRSQLKFEKHENVNAFISGDMIETPALIKAFTQYFLQLFIYITKPIVARYSNCLYQQIQKSKFLAEFNIDIMFVYDLMVLLCFHNLGQSPNFQKYYERRQFASIQQIMLRIIAFYKKYNTKPEQKPN